MNYNLDKLVEKAKNGNLPNIAKSGSSACFDVSDEYVLVVHKIVSSSEKFAELSNKLGDNNKCIYTVVAYKEDSGLVYELQKKAKGEHFRKDNTKQEVYDSLNRQKNQIEVMIKKSESGEFSLSTEQINSTMKPLITKLENEIHSPKFEKYIDTRKEELQNRYEKIINMPKEHIVDFFDSVLTLQDNKLEYDSSGNNVLYDEEKGFAIIDLTAYSKRQDLTGDISTILNSDNYQVAPILLGVDRLYVVPEQDKPELIEFMKEALKKICVSVINLEHNGQKMTPEIMSKSLDTYKKYGLDLSYEEVEKESKKGQIIT